MEPPSQDDPPWARALWLDEDALSDGANQFADAVSQLCDLGQEEADFITNADLAATYVCKLVVAMSRVQGARRPPSASAPPDAPASLRLNLDSPSLPTTQQAWPTRTCQQT